MKKLRCSVTARVIAMLLFAVMAFTAAYSALPVAYNVWFDGRHNSGVYSSYELERFCIDQANAVINQFLVGERMEDIDLDSAVAIELEDKNGEVVYYSTPGQRVPAYKYGMYSDNEIMYAYFTQFSVLYGYNDVEASADMNAAHSGDPVFLEIPDEQSAEPAQAGDETIVEAEVETTAATADDADSAAPETDADADADTAAIADADTAKDLAEAVDTDTDPEDEPTTAAGTANTASVEPGDAPAPTAIPTIAPTHAVTPTVTSAPTATPVLHSFAGTYCDSSLAPYTLRVYVMANIPADSALYYEESGLSDYAAQQHLIRAAVCAIIACLLYVFLLASAGCRAPDCRYEPGLIEKIPFDVYLAVCAIVIFAAVFVWAESFYAAESVFMRALGALAVAGGGVVFAGFSMSFALRLRLKTVVSSMLVYRVCAWCWRYVKRVIKWAYDIIKDLPLIPKAAIIVAALVCFDVVIMSTNSGFLMLVTRALAALVLFYVLISMKKLITATTEIASGDMDCRVDTTKLYGPLKEQGEALNSIGDGMTRAVNDRLKSEHFKTELITNVSHDIKTPLTSIINYVDLMQKEQIDNEKVNEYLDVLSRQSARLKKLIDDLMEASKASTGNLPVNPERCELGVLLTQTAGEYKEKLEDAGLELVIDKPDEDIAIMADRQHLWRVFDNLMNNICKYSLPGTRVYLDLARSSNIKNGKINGKAIVTFRNISKQRLSIGAEELVERGVRGDSSRNTQGSGLGLSIANSLTLLQGGEMELTVDGDLFKVILKFDIAE